MAVSYEYVPRGREVEAPVKKEKVSLSALNDNVNFWVRTFDEAEKHLESPRESRKFQRLSVDEAVKHLKRFAKECDDALLLKSIEAQIDRGKQLSRDLMTWDEKWIRRVGKTLMVFAVGLGVGKSLEARGAMQDEQQQVVAAQASQEAYEQFQVNHDLSVMEDESADSYQPATDCFHAFVSALNDKGSLKDRLSLAVNDPAKDLFQTYVKVGRVMNNDPQAFRLDRVFGQALAQETNRTPDQLRFTADVLDNGFFGRPDVTFGNISYARAPWTNYDFDSVKHADWYQDQFKQMTVFVDHQFTDVGSHLPPEAQSAFKKGLTDYVHTELAARVQLERIKEMGHFDNYKYLTEKHLDYDKPGQQEALQKVLHDIIQNRATAISHMYSAMEQSGAVTSFEAQQAQLMAEHQTLKKFHGILVQFVEREVQDTTIGPANSPGMDLIHDVEAKLTAIQTSLQKLDSTGSELPQFTISR